MTAARCLWCNQGDGELVTLDVLGVPAEVHPAHASETRSFLDLARRRQGRALTGILAAVAVIAVSVMTGLTLLLTGHERLGQMAIAVVLLAAVGIGVQVAMLPFATPETVRLLGLKRSILICRVFGAVLALATLALFWSLATLA